VPLWEGILIVVVVCAFGGVVGIPHVVEKAIVLVFHVFGHPHRRNSSPPPWICPVPLPDTLRR
jgi:hypothetical protein